jgi:hypothetical protein
MKMVSQEQLEVWRQILLDQKAGESAGMQTGFALEWLKYIDKLQADRKSLLDACKAAIRRIEILTSDGDVPDQLWEAITQAEKEG